MENSSEPCVYTELQGETLKREGYQQGHAAALLQIKKLVDRGLSFPQACALVWNHNQETLYCWRISADETISEPAPEIG